MSVSEISGTSGSAPSPDGWPDWPTYALIDDIRPALRDLMAGDRPFALATLVEVEGSSPRPVGSQMLLAEDGRIRGYVSGGCVEADLALRARAVLCSGTPEMVHYGRGSGNWDIQLTCGGRIGILVQRVTPGDPALVRVLSACSERREVALVIDLDTGALRTSDLNGPGHPARKVGGAGDAVAARQFTRIFSPVLRLLIVGGDPVALALAQLALPLGMEVRLNRPSGPVIPPDGVAPDAYCAGPVSPFLDSAGLDPWTAVVCVSHDMDLDHLVLSRALKENVLYAGALGSRRYREERLDRLRSDGVPDSALARLRNPVGLDIGARTAAEIALAVLAEIVDMRDCRASP